MNLREVKKLVQGHYMSLVLSPLILRRDIIGPTYDAQGSGWVRPQTAWHRSHTLNHHTTCCTGSSPMIQNKRVMTAKPTWHISCSLLWWQVHLAKLITAGHFNLIIHFFISLFLSILCFILPDQYLRAAVRCPSVPSIPKFWNWVLMKMACCAIEANRINQNRRELLVCRITYYKMHFVNVGLMKLPWIV